MAFPGFGATSSTFGSTAAPSFGAPAASTTTQSFGGFGTTFGAPSTAPSLSLGGATTTPSLFGASSAPSFGASTTPAFGASTTPSFGASTTPSFGSTAAPSFGATPSFGSTAAPPSFGATTPSFGTSTAPSFGATPSLSTPSFGSSPFGAAPTSTTTPFGTTPSLFGSSTPAFGASTFPSTTSTTPSLFGAQPQPQPQSQPQQPAQQTPLQKLEALFSCFNPQNPQCKFRHMFYNQINASADEVRRMNTMKPAHVDQLLWDQAIRNNPDITKFVPVQACGFEDLKGRIAEQDKLTNQQTQTLQDASKVIDAIKRKHTNETLAKLEDYKRRQLEIAQRLIRILEARGTRLTVGEEQLKRKFEMILQDLTSPTLYRAKIEDFISLSRITVPSAALPQVDERTLENIAKALKEQRAGLEVLTNMVQKDSKDVQLMLSELDPN